MCAILFQFDESIYLIAHFSVTRARPIRFSQNYICKGFSGRSLDHLKAARLYISKHKQPFSLLILTHVRDQLILLSECCTSNFILLKNELGTFALVQVTLGQWGTLVKHKSYLLCCFTGWSLTGLCLYILKRDSIHRVPKPFFNRMRELTNKHTKPPWLDKSYSFNKNGMCVCVCVCAGGSGVMTF